MSAEFITKPNPDQPDRCPSIDPHDTLQCTRRAHDDDQCLSGGIAWKKGTPRYLSDYERGLRDARAIVERQTDLTDLVHFEHPSDFRKGVLTCLAALDAAIGESQ